MILLFSPPEWHGKQFAQVTFGNYLLVTVKDKIREPAQFF